VAIELDRPPGNMFQYAILGGAVTANEVRCWTLARWDRGRYIDICRVNLDSFRVSYGKLKSLVLVHWRYRGTS